MQIELSKEMPASAVMTPIPSRNGGRDDSEKKM